MSGENDIKKFMAQKLGEGLSLAEIQKLIEEKFNKRMTFLDIRLMASALDTVDWEKEAAREKAEAEKDPETADKPEKDTADKKGKCVVELSKLVKPGAVAHGSVKFPSGVSGNWVLDQMGRLGMEKNTGEPTEADLKAFQKELQKLFSRGGA
ncbi:MAG: hypothetical protein PHV82_02190 [Victivallaceae bacterium]|nr:hypothetical protein [Victivallaceae bacterium]